MIKTKRNPTISIIIPTYNRVNSLLRAVRSVFNQTYKDFELIIVDDGSTDNTEKIVKDLQKQYRKLKYIKYEKNKGPAVARNTGIKIARGEYVAFLDSDDEWLSEKLEKQIQLFNTSAKKNLGFVSCDAFVVKETSHTLQRYITPRYKNIFERLLETNFICSSSSVVVKMLVIRDVGLFDKKLKKAQDYEMWIRIARKYDFDFVSKPLFKYYSHQGNTAKINHDVTYINCLHYIVQKYQSYYKEFPLVYSIRLKNIGIACITEGQLQKAKQYFLKSIKVNPLNFKSYFYLVFSLFDPKFYHKLSILKDQFRQLFQSYV